MPSDNAHPPAPSAAGPVCVQYGCGWSAPDGWHNFDASPTLRFERIPVIGKLYTKNSRRFPANVMFGDIVRGLPFAENTVDCVYASHVLEHLSHRDCLTAVRNTYAMMKPGGIFRVIVPDLTWRAAAYLQAAQAGDRGAALAFMHSTALGLEERGQGIVRRAIAFFGVSRHLWFWDEAALTDALLAAGFRSVRRCDYGDSQAAAFAMVEDKGRFSEDGHRELALEAIK